MQSGFFAGACRPGSPQQLIVGGPVRRAEASQGQQSTLVRMAEKPIKPAHASSIFQ